MGRRGISYRDRPADRYERVSGPNRWATPTVQQQLTRFCLLYEDLRTKLNAMLPECDSKYRAIMELDKSSMWAIKALDLPDPQPEVGHP